jgi:hydroxyacylglutathione hydrolase
MTPIEASAASDSGAIVLDMRLPRVFARAHLPGAVNLQFNRADLADRAEMALPKGELYIVHAEPDPVAAAAVRILRDAGFTVLGHVEGGLAAWRERELPVATLPVIDVDDLRAIPGLVPIDAREPFEFRHGHVPAAVPLPWTDAWRNAEKAPTGALAVLCADEVRSSFVASILGRLGRDVRLVTGGMVDWNERGYPVEKGAAA